MFNTNEHILHLYECIDELHDSIHELRMNQIINRTSHHLPPNRTRQRDLNIDRDMDRPGRELNLYENPYLPPLVNPWSDTLGLGLGLDNNLNSTNTGRRTRTSEVTGTATGTDSVTSLNRNRNRNRNRNVTGSAHSLSRPSNPVVTRHTSRTPNTNINRNSRSTRETTLPTPDNIEVTFFEPTITSVRERLDNIINRIQREHNLPVTGLATNLNLNLNSESEPERLTLGEINTGCETKIHTGEEETCSICREPINDQSIVREIKNCKHKFHLHCIDIWLENHRTCPICRGNITLNPETAGERERENASASASETNSVVNELD
jgi:hypothetical protein